MQFMDVYCLILTIYLCVMSHYVKLRNSPLRYTAWLLKQDGRSGYVDSKENQTNQS